MKKSLLFILIALLSIPTLSHAQEKNFISTGLNVNVLATDGEASASVTLGVGYHRMLGDKVSLGLNVAYGGADGLNMLETTLSLARYGRITDSFYYVPEIGLGPVFVLDGYGTGFGGVLSPLGLEFRPFKKVGFMFNILNLTYVTYAGIGVFNFEIGPSMSVNFRF
jgi:hypothetical protein